MDREDGSDEGLAFVFFVFPVRKLSPHDEESCLDDVEPDSSAEEDIVVHLEEGTGRMLEDDCGGEVKVVKKEEEGDED